MWERVVDMIKQLTIDTLGDIDDGRVRLAIDRDLEAICKDLMNRPFDSSRRSLTIKIDIIPTPRSDGVLETVDVDVTTVTKVPKRRAQPAKMQIKPSGQVGKFLWNDASQSDPKQMTLDQRDGGGTVDPTTGELLSD